MTTLAYCALSFRRSVALAAGVTPLTSPPLTSGTFHHTWLEGHRLLYLKLHGLPNQPYLYGDGWTTALSADTITQADLSHSVVFAPNCHLDQSPILAAMLHSGATVIGGTGPNFARSVQVFGTDVLGRALRWLLQARLPPSIALAAAKTALRRRAQKDAALLDALNFRIFKEDHSDPTSQ